MKTKSLFALLVKLSIVAILIILILIAFIIVPMFCHGTDVAFQSSDGLWADTEVQAKGRNFSNAILPSFIQYKSCAKRAVILQRVTKKPRAISLKTILFNDYSESKWAVPLAEPTGVAAKGYFGFGPCNGHLSYEEVKKQADAYIAELSHNQNRQ